MGVIKIFKKNINTGWHAAGQRPKPSSGQTLVEMLVAIGLAAIMLPALATAIIASREGRAQDAERLQASALLRQATEAVRSVREKGWTAFAVNGTYHPTLSVNAWVLTAGSETIGSFTRKVVVADVQRNSLGVIVTSGGTVDGSTKKVTVEVSWTDPVSTTLSTDLYLQRYLGNAAWTQTSLADFTAAGSVATSTLATATGGGQVELAPGNIPKQLQSNTNTNDATATTIAQSFTANVQGGDLIVVVVSWNSSATTTVTCSDNNGNTYTNAISTNDATGVRAQAICYAPNVQAGSTTVTATFGASSTFRRLSIHEYRGILATAPVDITKSAVAANTTATDNVSTGNMTTTVAGDLIFGAVTESGTATAVTITAGTNYTQRTLISSEVASQDRVQAAAGAIASTNTFNKVSRYVAQAVAFKPSSSPGSWAPPNILSAVDVPGTEDQVDVQVSGNYAYVADSAILSIYDVTSPGSPVAMGTYTAGGTINDMYVSGNYVYLATSNTSGELTIVNATNKSSLTTAALVNAPNNDIGLAVYVRGVYAYLGRAFANNAGRNEFYIYDVTNPASPVQKGSLDTTAQVNAIYVPTADHAYLATSATAAEISVIRITTVTAPVAAGTYDANGTSIGVDITGDGTHVFLVKANNTSGAEFFELTPNVSVPTAVTFTLNGSYEAGANLNGVVVSGTTAFLATSITNAQLQVINITTPASITLTGSLNLAAVANEVDVSGSYAYLATAHDTHDLIIAQPLPTALTTYETSGTFESSSFDATASAAFNYVTLTTTQPAGTNLTFQIATNNDNATWNYVGPDGTAGTSYSVPATIRLNTTGRYIRYKATLTGPGTSTPVLSDISINYSP
jgi:type II secretory pathway pseudopilin PulG